MKEKTLFEHHPTPWEITYLSEDNEVIGTILDSHGREVLLEEIRPENVQELITIVNSHRKLVEALRASEHLIQSNKKAILTVDDPGHADSDEELYQALDYCNYLRTRAQIEHLLR